ncbi:hypothetical protein V498_09529 [Pseudogymnoascus sp. VKM F-4517 (FW-2822)]|nr:hypothetical protein V498_09529 [Pseudogymnoascus sp. VKM F-4517 (FW-2822)]
MLVPHITPDADTSPERARPAARAPAPPGAAREGEVVVPERGEGGDGADEGAGEDVEAVVAEIRVPRRGDVHRGACWDEG